jgi:DNA-binding winged helix-turn-helix (wHTH) protein
MNEAVIQRTLFFDRFSLDLMRGCLRAGEQDIELRPKVFEVLQYLVHNSGRLVAKQELLEAIWPNVTVSNDSIMQCIRELRDKLGDDNHSLIKTVPRRGYLLDAAVSVEAPQRAEKDQAVMLPDEQPRARLGSRQAAGSAWPHRVALWAAIAALVFGAGWWVPPTLGWSPARLVTQPKLEQPQTAAQFDGFWRVEWFNNAHCTVKTSWAIWIIREGIVITPGSSKITATLSSTGELRYTIPSMIDPNLTNVALATLQGERGQGRWDGQKGCGGVFTLERTKLQDFTPLD